MSKNYKILITCWFVFIAIAGVIGYWQRPSNQVLADVSSGAVCSEFGKPIPIGEVIEETVEVMDYVFQIYQAQANNLDLALSDIQSAVAMLTENKNVCDFGKCQSQVGNAGFKQIGLELVAYFIGPFGLYLPDVPPICQPKECIGQPCPDLSPYVQGKQGADGFVGLDALRKTFSVSAQLIHDWFSEKSVPITKDIEEDDDPVGGYLTRIESIERKAKRVELLTTPWSGVGSRTCVVNELERALIERGELDPVTIELCSNVLLGAASDKYYWPKAWSPFCAAECDGRSDEECSRCLVDKCDQTANRNQSWFADINCQLYKDCKNKCVSKDIIDEECYQCLCQRFETEDDPNQACLNWVCGGSSGNFVCCQ